MSAVDEVFRERDCPDPADPYWTPETISRDLTRVAKFFAQFDGPPLSCNWNFAAQRCNRCGLNYEGSTDMDWCPALPRDKRDAISQATRDVSAGR